MPWQFSFVAGANSPDSVRRNVKQTSHLCDQDLLIMCVSGPPTGFLPHHLVGANTVLEKVELCALLQCG